MSEPVEGQAPQSPETPAQPAAPAAPAPASPEGLTPEMEAWVNSRIAGLQSGYQAQINAAQAQAQAAAAQAAEFERQLKISQMSEEEREQQATEEADAYLSETEKQAALFQLYQQYPPEKAQLLAKLYTAQSPEEIAALLDSITGAATPEPAAQVPPVDPNNPPATPPASQAGVFLGPDGQSYDKQMRQEILQRLSAGGTSMADLLKRR